jgi:hypothetical protein
LVPRKFQAASSNLLDHFYPSFSSLAKILRGRKFKNFVCWTETEIFLYLEFPVNEHAQVLAATLFGVKSDLQ